MKPAQSGQDKTMTMTRTYTDNAAINLFDNHCREIDRLAAELDQWQKTSRNGGLLPWEREERRKSQAAYDRMRALLSYAAYTLRDDVARVLRGQEPCGTGAWKDRAVAIAETYRLRARSLFARRGVG